MDSEKGTALSTALPVSEKGTSLSTALPISEKGTALSTALPVSEKGKSTGREISWPVPVNHLMIKVPIYVLAAGMGTVQKTPFR